MPNLKKDSTLIIDGNAYLYRFFHGAEPRFKRDGTATHVIYSYMVYIRTCLSRYKPKRLIVVFDAPGKNFRHSLYPAYKEHRNPMPDELASQISASKAAIKFLGIPVIEIDDVEADDTIGTLAKYYAQKGEMTYIFSIDKDLTQLVSDKVHIVHDRKRLILDRNAVIEKFSVPPELIIDLLALTGDDADNIPGVEGVGIKTAAKMIQTWGAIENILANSHWVKGKVGDNLRNSVDKLTLSKKLTTIRLDVPIQFEDNCLELIPENKLGIRKLCKEYEFIQ